MPWDSKEGHHARWGGDATGTSKVSQQKGLSGGKTSIRYQATGLTGEEYSRQRGHPGEAQGAGGGQVIFLQK